MKALYETHDATSVQEEMELRRIVEAMCNLATMDLTYSQFEESAPMADELVHYLTESLENKHYVNNTIDEQQVGNLAAFGTKFSIDEPVYWEMVTLALEDNLKEMRATQIMQTMTLLQESGRLDEATLFNCLDELKGKLASLKPSECSFYLLVLTSDIS